MRGFTLVELLLSTGIAATVAASFFSLTVSMQRATAVFSNDALLIGTAQSIERIARAHGRTRHDTATIESAVRAGVPSTVRIDSFQIKPAVYAPTYIQEVSFMLRTGVPERELPVSIFLHHNP